MKYNGELKIIDTQEKAYLLGFLYGDGCICTIVEKTGSVRHITKISIHKNDEKLIIDLHDKFPFFYLGNFDYQKYNPNCGKQVSIRNSNKNLYDDLMLNGLYPRKSYENKDKLHLPNIDDKLISHFIRGFFDADGSVYIPTKRKNLLSIEFCSVSKELIVDINNYLISKNIQPWKIKEKIHKDVNRQTIYQLIYNKTSEIQKLIEFMYNDASICLERKANKCLSYKPVDKVLDRNFNCPRCNSTKVWSNGVRGKSTRFKCQDCGNGFSIKNYSK